MPENETGTAGNTTSAEKIFKGIVAILVWAGLILQFYLSIYAYPDLSISSGVRLLRFFSYFTVLSNLLVAVSLTSYLVVPRSTPGRFSSLVKVRTAVAVYIAAVGLVYSLFLRGPSRPAGLPSVANHLLHDAVPILYSLYWIIFVPKGTLAWRHPLSWLIFPAAYILYSLIHGSVSGWYPYYFANAGTLGPALALRNVFFIIAGFFGIGIFLVALDKLMARTANRAGN
jgi:hypothetical protein